MRGNGRATGVGLVEACHIPWAIGMKLGLALGDISVRFALNDEEIQSADGSRAFRRHPQRRLGGHGRFVAAKGQHAI